ncbi:MAG: hypothetical protein ACR652_23110 [Methylocystis sp.]|uniref:hypothetical protein n=1 Tax=Methylocystis sp. TaxID=1911079 RepID=UPI003DA26E1A
MLTISKEIMMAEKLRAFPGAAGKAQADHKIEGFTINSEPSAAADGLQARRRRFLERRGVPEPLVEIVAEHAFGPEARQ